MYSVFPVKLTLKELHRTGTDFPQYFPGGLPLFKIKKNLKYLIVALVSVLIIIVGMITYSFLFPRKVSFLDTARLTIEPVIVQKIVESEIGRRYINEKNIPVEGPTDISFVETSSYRHFLEPGDVVFTNSRRYLGSLLIKGKWKHSVIYIGTKAKVLQKFGPDSAFYLAVKKYYIRGDEDLIIDSSLQGVRIREFSELSNLKDVSYLQSILAFRPQVSTIEKKRLIDNVLDQVNKEYDFDLLTFNRDALYCSELIYGAFKVIGIDIDISSRFINRKVMTPTDIVQFIAHKGIAAHKFSFLFFIEKNQYEIVERSIRELL